MLVLIISMLYACSEKSSRKENQQIVKVDVGKVEKVNGQETYTYSGQVEIENRSQVSFLVGGMVDLLHFSEGDMVRKGSLLSEIANEDYKNDLQLQEARLLEAEDMYNRLSALYERSSIPESDFIKAKARYLSAKAVVRIAKKKLADTKVFAPYDAIIIRKMVEVGTIVQPGTPIYEIVSSDEMIAVLSVPQDEIDHLKLGDHLIMTVPSLRDNKIRGEISAIIPVADRQTRSYTVKANILDANPSLKDGMLVNAQVTTNSDYQYVIVPGNAVVRSAENINYIFTYDDSGKKVARKRVTVGAPYKQGIIIEKGLEADEVIVVAGQSKLVDGATVKTEDNAAI